MYIYIYTYYFSINSLLITTLHENITHFHHGEIIFGVSLVFTISTQ